MKLKENDLFKNISLSDLSKKVIEYYRNSNNKDAIVNNIKNIDKNINDISSKLGIKKETFKENKTIRDFLENMKEEFNKLKNNTQNQNKKNKKNKKK